ncbi:MAG: T9SS type B sorting domain-containing protein [Flavobacteriales bacterium]
MWNGRVDGKPVPSNTYWFAIDFKDNVTPTIKSHITIKRENEL